MHRPDLTDWADQFFLVHRQGFSRRTTFGCPALYLGKSMVAFVHDDSLVIKLPKDRVEEMMNEDDEIYGVFSPAGNPMRSWLTITLPEADDYARVETLIEESIAFVAPSPKPKSPKKRTR